MYIFFFFLKTDRGDNDVVTFTHVILSNAILYPTITKHYVTLISAHSCRDWRDLNNKSIYV